MVTITELLGGSKQTQILTGFLLLFVLYVVRTFSVLTVIDNVAFPIVMRIQLAVAVRTVVATGSARNNFISEGLLANLACILPSAVVPIQVPVVGTALGTVAFVGKVRSALDWLDVIEDKDVFCS